MGMMRIRDRTGGSCTVREMTMTGGSIMPSAWGTETYTGSECPASVYVSGP